MARSEKTARLDRAARTQRAAHTQRAARTQRTKGIEPTWPVHGPGEHVVTELVAAVQGSLSPYGDTTFPLEKTPYEHPVTVINR